MRDMTLQADERIAELESQQRRDTAELEKIKRQLDDANNIKSETLKKLRAMAAQMERDERQLTDLQRQVADGNGTVGFYPDTDTLLLLPQHHSTPSHITHIKTNCRSSYLP